MSRAWRSEAGGAAVEVALALPLLVLIFAGTVDFARVFYTTMELTNAARAGAQYGAYNAAHSGDVATMEATATGAVNLTGVAAAASRRCQCATDGGTFSATSPSANNCTSPASTSCPGQHLIIYVTVTTSKQFQTVMGGVLPLALRSLTVNRSATLRAMQQP